MDSSDEFCSIIFMEDVKTCNSHRVIAWLSKFSNFVLIYTKFPAEFSFEHISFLNCWKFTVGDSHLVSTQTIHHRVSQWNEVLRSFYDQKISSNWSTCKIRNSGLNQDNQKNRL